MRSITFLVFFLLTYTTFGNVEARVKQYLKESQLEENLREKVTTLRPILFENKFKEDQELSVYIFDLLKEARMSDDRFLVQYCRALLSANYLNGEKLLPTEELLEKIGRYFEDKDIEIAYSLEASRLLVYTKMGNNTKAIQASENCRRLSEKVDLPEMEGSMLITEARVYMNMGQDDKAQDILGEAINIARENKWNSNEAKALSLMGELIQMQGDLSMAEDLFQQSADIALKNGRLDLLAEAQTQLGIVEFYRGNMNTSEELFIKALENHRKRQAHTMVCQSLYNLGVFHFDNQQLDEALPFYLEGLELAKKYNFVQEELDLLMELANLAKSKGNYKNAAMYFENYLEVQDEKLSEESKNDAEFRATWLDMKMQELRDESEEKQDVLNNELQTAKTLSISFGFVSTILAAFLMLVTLRQSRVKKAQAASADVHLKTSSSAGV